MWNFVKAYRQPAFYALIIGVVTAAYRHILRTIKKGRSETAAVKDLMVAQARDRLIQSYYFHVKKGSWPVDSRDAVFDLYKRYELLGGNGTVSRMMEVLHKLEIREDDAREAER